MTQIITRFLMSYGSWLHIWYLRFTVDDYTFGILDLWWMITPLVS